MDIKEIKAKALVEFAEKIKKYYAETLKGSTPTSLVAYYIDQKLQDELRRLDRDEDTSEA